MLIIICLLYLGYIIIDKNAHCRERRNIFVANWRIWTLIGSYFPSHLIVKSANTFKTHTPYFFCIHPHGILSVGALTNFIPENAGIRKTIKNVEPRICGLKLALMIPVFRELLLALGFVSASPESLRYLADNGLSAMLVVGGAEEALHAYPGSTSLVLEKRRGFVKMALETGAQLVPVYIFGENDLFDRIPGLQKLQRWLQQKMTFAMPLFYGKLYLPIPYRRTLTTVVGDPIPHPVKGTLDERVDAYHAMYVKALTDLFEHNVQIYGSDLDKRTARLHLVK